MTETTKGATGYYRADDCHKNDFYVVRSQGWTKYQTIMAKCSSKDYADEIVEALNAGI